MATKTKYIVTREGLGGRITMPGGWYLILPQYDRAVRLAQRLDSGEASEIAFDWFHPDGTADGWDDHYGEP